MKAKIFDIKRFAVHDGDGIRTTVFFKGCPLKCIWCHNPEGLSYEPQLAYYKNKCISCGDCVTVCPHKAHVLKNGIHVFERKNCTLCGKCVVACLSEALTIYGKDITVDELMPLLLEDKDFYKTSGGGVTLSGGECLMQSEFCAELLRRLKTEKIHTAVDTCGFVPKAALDRVMPYTDIFLYDVKAFDENVHIRCTGQSNRIILDNLKYLDEEGAKTEIRIPYVPGYNSEEIEKIAAFLSQCRNVMKIRVLPYHNYARSKYGALNMENTLPKNWLGEEELKQARKTLKSICDRGAAKGVPVID